MLPPVEKNIPIPQEALKPSRKYGFYRLEPPSEGDIYSIFVPGVVKSAVVNSINAFKAENNSPLWNYLILEREETPPGWSEPVKGCRIWRLEDKKSASNLDPLSTHQLKNRLKEK